MAERLLSQEQQLPSKQDLRSDNELIKSFQTGDVDAFDTLYRRYVKDVYNVGRVLVGGEDAKDLTSITFYEALRGITRFQPQDVNSFKSWLLVITATRAKNWRRGLQRRQRYLSTEIASSYSEDQFESSMDNPIDVVVADKTIQDPVENIHRSQLAAELRGVLGRIPEDRRLLVALRFVQDLSNAQIAKIMGKSEGAVKALLHRTMVSLKNDISQCDPDSALGEMFEDFKSSSKTKWTKS